MCEKPTDRYRMKLPLLEGADKHSLSALPLSPVIDLAILELHGQVEHNAVAALPLQLGGEVHVDDDQGSTLHQRTN